MAFDPHANLVVSTVAIAPSPATSGTTLTVTTGDGPLFINGSYYLASWPAAQLQRRSNTEIMRVQARASSSDQLTGLLRAQGGTTAKSIAVGDNVAMIPTKETFEAIEAYLGDAYRRSYTAALVAANMNFTIPGFIPNGVVAQSFVLNNDYYFPIWCEDTTVFDLIRAEVTTASGTPGSVARLALYSANASWQPTGNLIEEFPTILTDALGIVSSTPATGSRSLPKGRYVLALNMQVTSSLRGARGCPSGGPIVIDAIGAFMLGATLSVPRAHGAFSSPGTAWAATVTGTGIACPLFMRLTSVG